MKNIQTGFSIIELMMAVAIISILAAIAIPSYADYIARTKANAAYIELSGTKINVITWQKDHTVMPTLVDLGIKNFTGICENTITGTIDTLVITCIIKEPGKLGAASTIAMTFSVMTEAVGATPASPGGVGCETTVMDIGKFRPKGCVA